MLKNISVPVLVASLLAGSAVIAAGSAIAHDTKSLDAKAQATVDQPVALGNTDMSAAKKAAKKTKKGTTTKKET
jgi:predicted outer membrane protein